MRGMAVGMFIFFGAIAKATFIESDETTQAAKVWVYNALWFEILLVFLSINLIANIMRYQMWKREKVAVFAFHLAFLIIIIGAACTRYLGFEGMMHIREGEATNEILGAEPYVYLNVNNGKLQYRDSIKKYMSETYPNSVNFKAEFPGRTPVTVEYVDFKSKYVDSFKIDPKSNKTALDIVVNGVSNKVMDGEDIDVGGLPLTFSKSKVEGINIYNQGDSLVIKSSLPMQSIAMSSLQKSQRQAGATIADSLYKSILPNTVTALKPKTLYSFAGRQFAFKQAYSHASKVLMPSGNKKKGNDYLTLRIKDGGKSKMVTLKGGIDAIADENRMIFSFNGLNYSMSYGRRFRTIPFYVQCSDFQMERYPGSTMASSFASDIVIVDEKNNVNKKKHLFMNHVVDYNGYRFFQSSYDEDEKGTVLSVNYDAVGTNITYLGYLLMAIGMILSLTSRNGRFRELLGKLSKTKHVAGALILPLLLTSYSFAQTEAEHNHEHNANHTIVAHKPIARFATEEQAEGMASLLVQDFSGRIIPYHTLCDQLLRKLYYSNKYEGHNAVQVITSMHMYPEYWSTQKIIMIPAVLREPLKLEKYVTMQDISSPDFDFKWRVQYDEALKTPEVKQSDYQKKLIKLGEKFQVFASITLWQYFRVLPIKGDPNNTWTNPFEIKEHDPVASDACLKYIRLIDESAQKPSKNGEANGALMDLKALQRQNSPASILPTETMVKLEVSYNKMEIFKHSESLYFLFGTLLLIVYLLKILINPKNDKGFKITRTVLVVGMVITFLYHAYGLGVRSYISGHAPWSDGYEALVFIAWVTILAGFTFTRRNAGILACAAILAGCMIFVTEMELLDPQVTPLQPVLKSYWLKVHVAVITSSYAFLGLACVIGILNLILYLFRTMKNGTRITQNINELTYVSELTMTIGTFLLTIGTFLGGIWANESWGRYWGWDPKETWALASVLVYAIILHLRYIPGLQSKFVFNAVSVFGYASIMFTFFGVNFILVGLHSYAQGDGAVSFPNYVWYTVFAFIVLAIVAGLRNRSYNKVLKASL